ncbi:MAG TPA: hypothetical protein VM582_04495 [Candidatus Thermoplasmatota archaeon]|nr:hypothetical protein [Candidatus Thermoplasmatota archaeon]
MPLASWRLPALALALLLAPLVAASPLGAQTHVVARDNAYLVDHFVVDVDGTLLFTNLDLRAHDVVAFASGPDTNPWCGPYPAGACPLFATPLIGLAEQVVVEGTSQLTPRASYPFYCSTHRWMVGTLHAI